LSDANTREPLLSFGGPSAQGLRIGRLLPEHAVILLELLRATAMTTSVKAGKRSDKRWTPKEDQQLLDLFAAEASWPLIAITMERGVEDVRYRAGKLRHEVELGLKAKGK
jgi:hypothetical protein